MLSSPTPRSLPQGHGTDGLCCGAMMENSTTKPVSHEDWVDVARLFAIFIVVFYHVVSVGNRLTYLRIGSVGWFACDVLNAGAY